MVTLSEVDRVDRHRPGDVSGRGPEWQHEAEIMGGVYLIRIYVGVELDPVVSIEPMVQAVGTIPEPMLEIEGVSHGDIEIVDLEGVEIRGLFVVDGQGGSVPITFGVEGVGLEVDIDIFVRVVPDIGDEEVVSIWMERSIDETICPV